MKAKKMLTKLEHLARKVKMASYQSGDEGWPRTSELLLEAVGLIAQARQELKPPE